MLVSDNCQGGEMMGEMEGVTLEEVTYLGEWVSQNLQKSSCQKRN